MTGGELRALRRARGWTVKRLVHEFRQAADEALPRSLDQMVRAWEAGRYTPREEYRHLYEVVFGLSLNGGGDLASLAGRLGARLQAMPGPEQLSALEAAALAALPGDRAAEVRAWAEAAAGHLEEARQAMQQITDALAGNGDE